MKAQLYFLVRRLEKSSLLSLLFCSCSPLGRPLPRLEMGSGDGDGRGGERDKEDSRSQADPLPAQEFLLEPSKAGRYVKFKMLSWHGSGGGLQFFEMIEGNNLSTLSTV